MKVSGTKYRMPNSLLARVIIILCCIALFSKHSVASMYSIVYFDVQACKWPKPHSQLQQFSIKIIIIIFQCHFSQQH